MAVQSVTSEWPEPPSVFAEVADVSALNTQAAEFKSDDPAKNLVTPASISFENIGLTLKDKSRVTILKDVCGIIPPKALVALMGPSGCGKTTFMNTILKNTPCMPPRRAAPDPKPSTTAGHTAARTAPGPSASG